MTAFGETLVEVYTPTHARNVCATVRAAFNRAARTVTDRQPPKLIESNPIHWVRSPDDPALPCPLRRARGGRGVRRVLANAERPVVDPRAVRPTHAAARPLPDQDRGPAEGALHPPVDRYPMEWLDDLDRA